MKKYGIIAIVLLLIAASGIGAAHQTINKLKDDVSISETVLMGDPAVAEGITVTTNSEHMAMPLRWETSYTVGRNDSLTCDFQYQKKGSSEEEKTFYELYPDANLLFGPDTEEEYQDPDDEEVGYFPKEPMKQAAARTKAGTVHKEKILLNDYMEYYELNLDATYYDDLGFHNNIIDDGQTSQYLRIPILENSIWTIRVKKDSQDNIISINNIPEKAPYIYTAGTLDDSAVYLFVTDMKSYSKNTENGEQITLPKRVCGLHRIPFKDDKKFHLDASNAELVLPMEQGQHVIHPVITEDSDGQKILRYFTLTNEKLEMVLMNMSTFNIEQSIPLPYEYQGQLPHHFQVIENEDKTEMVIIDDQNQFSFLAKDNSDKYVHILSDTLLRKNPLDFIFLDYKVDWIFDDQNRLIIAYMTGKPEPESKFNGNSSSYQLSVYEKNRLLYAGFYENNLDDDVAYYDEYSLVQAASTNSITLSVPSAP